MNRPLLSIVCVTKLEPFALPFIEGMNHLAKSLAAEFVLAVDGTLPRPGMITLGADRFIEVHSAGFIESVLDEAVAATRGAFVLRLDDDERCSPAMVAWLARGEFLRIDHWCFPRMHLWPDAMSFLDDPQLWPDHQTRLSVREKSGGRGSIHAMSPYGMGHEAPCAIEHHKFLVKSYAERAVIADKWHRGNMTAFSLPEDSGRALVSRPTTEALRVSVS